MRQKCLIAYVQSNHVLMPNLGVREPMKSLQAGLTDSALLIEPDKPSPANQNGEQVKLLLGSVTMSFMHMFRSLCWGLAGC